MTSASPSVSILMPNMNNALVLDEVLEKLAVNTQQLEVEVIVADDGSTDESLPILRRWRDSGRFAHFVLLEREHGGIIPALNDGLAHAQGEYLVRIDGDTTVETPGWLERMLAFHTSDERIGVTVGKVIFDDGRIHTFGVDVVVPEGLHERGSTVGEPPGRRTIGGPVRHPHERDATGGDRPAEVDSALGCWTMCRTDLARELGGWDMGYNPVWYEDIDFNFAVRATADRKVFFLPDVRIIHHVGRRDPRLESDRRKLLLFKTNRAIGRYVPQRAKDMVARQAKVGERDPKKLALLESHAAHWERKWGFHPNNPDLDAIRRRYAGTEVLWRYDDERRAAGEAIVERWLARTSA